MAIYRNISLTFWEDVKVVDDFTPEDRYFYLYLLTNPHTNLLGCYQLSFRQMVNETGYNRDSIEKLIKRMEENHNVIQFDKETSEIHIKKWHKYNWTKSDKLLKSVEKLIPTIKSDFLRQQLQEKFKKYTVLIGYQYPMDTTVSVSVSVSGTVTDTVYKYVEENFSRNLAPIEKEKIDKWILEFQDDVIKYAIQISVMNNKKTFSYIEGVLNNWKNKGYKTLKDIKQNEKTKANNPEWFDKNIDQNIATLEEQQNFEEKLEKLRKG